MPKRTDIKSILIIGAGPIIIGQACEFDYSGAQACKALREEGYKVILVNSNPATIMTDPNTADVTYIEPISWEVVERIIAKERPDAILPTMGGQTALNCALDLFHHGVLEKYKVELIGASPEAIDKAEDRQKFKEAMTKIGLGSAKSGIAHSMEEALQVQAEIAAQTGSGGYPTVIRPSFTLGGSGGGIAYNKEEFEEICSRGLDLSPTRELLIEESLLGWKEYEMEVVRDTKDNCIIVCSIENLDPMGVHTGDSITVAPAQTLTDKEYQILRNASLAVLREIGVDTGGSNVQFAINPKDGRMVVIEMNPRVSRSSALASKATGFPIAKVAAKLAVGYTLDELRNEITGGQTPASFEPTIDYVVTKIPRFAFEKFREADSRLTTQMKSVGEVMAIGRTFQESFQKALRGLEVGVDGLDEKTTSRDEAIREIGEPGPDRIWFLGDAFRLGLTPQEIFEETSIDPWFLAQIEQIVLKEKALAGRTLESLSREELLYLKQSGFSDRRLAKLTGSDQTAVRRRRHELKVRPVYKRVDTCAAEFATKTAYMYSTYEEECEANPTDKKKIMVLGGGPNRIGQGIEFDYCCVHAALAMREDGYETIMVNCNPETVSTDYDTSDRLYFESLTLEDVLEIVDLEKPVGVIVQYGGQTPLKLALDLEANGVPIIGTSPDMIDAAEDRERFQKLLQDLNLRQPPNRTARAEGEALKLAEEIGYPLVVRPSYVLGGRAMEIVHEPRDLERYMREAVKVSNDSPVLLDRFLNDAIECDVDCISDGDAVFIGGVMEHIEQAGVHSGDSACSLPPYSLSQETVDELKRQTGAMARALERDRPDERAVRDPASPAGRRLEEGRHLRAGSESARVAYGALRVEGDGPAARQDRRARDGRPEARGSGRDERSDSAVLQREGSRVPVREVPGGRSGARTRNALDGRSDGRRPHVRRSALQVATGGGLASAGVGHGAPDRDGRRQAEGGRGRGHAARTRLPDRRDQGHGGGHPGGRHPGQGRQQGEGRPSAHRRHDQERRNRARLHDGRRNACRDRRFALDPHERAGQQGHVLHDDVGRARGGRGTAVPQGPGSL